MNNLLNGSNLYSHIHRQCLFIHSRIRHFNVVVKNNVFKANKHENLRTHSINHQPQTHTHTIAATPEVGPESLTCAPHPDTLEPNLSPSGACVRNKPLGKPALTQRPSLHLNLSHNRNHPTSTLTHTHIKKNVVPCKFKCPFRCTASKPIRTSVPTQRNTQKTKNTPISLGVANAKYLFRRRASLVCVCLPQEICSNIFCPSIHIHTHTQCTMRRVHPNIFHHADTFNSMKENGRARAL